MISLSKGEPGSCSPNYCRKKGIIIMHIILSLFLSLLLTISSPGILGAKTDSKAAKSPPKPTLPVQDLEAAATDLQENIKDLRHNINSWRKIQWDSQLTPVAKKQWRDKAATYLQECEAYYDLLAKVDAKKLPKSELSRRFLNDRQTFQREVQYLRQTLQQP
jgi:hypothetical protein